MALGYLPAIRPPRILKLCEGPRHLFAPNIPQPHRAPTSSARRPWHQDAAQVSHQQTAVKLGLLRCRALSRLQFTNAVESQKGFVLRPRIPHGPLKA